MMYQGGPKDGEPVDPQEAGAEEIRFSRVYDDGENLVFWYSRDSFGNMMFRGFET